MPEPDQAIQTMQEKLAEIPGFRFRDRESVSAFGSFDVSHCLAAIKFLFGDPRLTACRLGGRFRLVSNGAKATLTRACAPFKFAKLCRI